MNDLIIPLILAGGSGMRLWPISRISSPKQLVNFDSNNSMLQNTVIRLNDIEGIVKPLIVCNNECKYIVAEQLKEIGKKDCLIIVEPVARNTAPALALAVLKLTKFYKQNQICLVAPADHHILNFDRFKKALLEGRDLAKQGYIVTFGIIPTRPEIGYGYIKKGDALHQTTNCDSNKNYYPVFVEQFVEKPNIETATTYLKSGNYVWNSGIFMFRADRMIQELEFFVPDILKACKLALKSGREKDGFFYLDEESFLSCDKISIDAAIMEKITSGVMIPMDVGWEDLGSWHSLYQHEQKDTAGNVVSGDILVHDVKNSYLYSESRLVAAVGIEEHVVVETKDAVLVAPINRSQDIKHLVSGLLHENRAEVFSHKRHYCSWGEYEELFVSDVLTITLIVIKSGNWFLIHKYFKSKTNWVVVSGQGVFKNETSMLYLNEGESIRIEENSNFSIYNSNESTSFLKLIELRGKNLWFQ